MPFDEQPLLKEANVLKGLAHPVRIHIVRMLDGREVCACDIAEYFPVDRTTVSKHLALMTELGILRSRKEGANVFYTLQMRCVVPVLECIRTVIEGGMCGEN